MTAVATTGSSSEVPKGLVLSAGVRDVIEHQGAFHSPAHPGWLLSRVACAYVGDAAVSSLPEYHPGTTLSALFAAPRSAPLAEDKTRRVEPVFFVKGKACRTCHGEGSRTCDLGEQHECRTCDGEGSIGDVRAKHGTRVYSGDGVDTLLAGDLALVLDGLEVRRTDYPSGPSEPAMNALVGLDANGDVVAIVMPVRP